MSKWRLRSRIARSLVVSPLVGVPIGLGCAMWLFGSLLGDDGGFLVFLGVSGLLFGIAAAVSRWRRHGPRIRQAAAEKFRDVSNRNHEQFLNDLDRRVRTDDDERTNQHLAMLRQLHRRMRPLGVFDGDLPVTILPEVKEKTEQLYRSCLSSLERSLVLRDAALEMMTESARRKLFKSRESRAATTRRSRAARCLRRRWKSI